MSLANAVDSLNRRTIRSSVQEYSAIVQEGLNSQERAALARLAHSGKAPRVLDLGVGAGRTVEGLRALGGEYVGTDYVREMVEHCRARFPGVRFEQIDARSMTPFEDGAFDLVMFSCNGISMVDHEGRLAILKEVHRVLSPNGAFVFSTCNRNSPQYAALFRFPEFQSSLNPARLAVRAARYLGRSVFRAMNRRRYRRHEVRRAEYSIINDVCHDYRTMLYFIDIPSQRRQLERAGFRGAISVFDLSGKPVVKDSRDGTIAFVAEKQPGRCTR